MTYPSENHRNLIYSTIIQGTRPMTRADYVCEDCERDYFACECFAIPKQIETENDHG